MAKTNVKKAKKHLSKLRELIVKRKHPFSEMTEEQVIKALRKTREEIWKEKVASRS
ncbi:MAG: hypothetical protein M1510_03955 [Nitrospirae bacterium]|nr:hypothetical protein [Nitrospirota bacterium]MCL5237106.1 hypothetical protein [Nitrospirota bacterium]